MLNNTRKNLKNRSKKLWYCKKERSTGYLRHLFAKPWLIAQARDYFDGDSCDYDDDAVGNVARYEHVGLVK